MFSRDVYRIFFPRVTSSFGSLNVRECFTAVVVCMMSFNGISMLGSQIYSFQNLSYPPSPLPHKISHMVHP